MSKNDEKTNLSDIHGVRALALRASSSDQSERLIAVRLQAATNVEINQDASIAWRERKIIRDRMRYYTSPHTRVIN